MQTVAAEQIKRQVETFHAEIDRKMKKRRQLPRVSKDDLFVSLDTGNTGKTASLPGLAAQDHYNANAGKCKAVSVLEKERSRENVSAS
ncbi:MAG: hypothetical protein K2P48_06620 [Lachnospiraceae bacterium]|nr:hypothetical protein [Lachnospiraceae bacterium]